MPDEDKIYFPMIVFSHAGSILLEQRLYGKVFVNTINDFTLQNIGVLCLTLQ